MARRNRPKGKPQNKRDLSPRRADLKPLPIHVIIPAGKCGRKDRYATAAEAEAALRKVQRHREAHGGKMEKRFYSCDRCNGFHLTGMEKNYGTG